VLEVRAAQKHPDAQRDAEHPSAPGPPRLFDKGEGPPLVVIQGLHGRWEWSTSALQALAKRCRTISYSLSGDFGSGCRYEPASGFDNYVRQLDAVLDAAGVTRAALCGVSFGGFVAVRYAALRPERVSALVLASAPGPGWSPSPQQARWLSKPWLSAPIFVATAPLRVWPEVRCALGAIPPALAFLVRQGLRAAAAPAIPSLMSARVRDARTLDLAEDCARVEAPTLVVSGEERLDRVVPVEATRQYASFIKGARYTKLERTGHLGVLTQPDRFARLIGDFVHAHDH
jgi:3-oxoadipate enol-lactonase